MSIATVSRVINNLGGYSQSTKEKVERVIEELKYQPNAIARGLINRRSETIGVLFPEVSNMLASKILSGVEEAVHIRDSSVIVCNTESSVQKTLKYLKVLQEKRIDGIIFVSEMVTEEYYKALVEMNIPIVLVSTESYQYSLPFVKVNDRHASFSATDYLIKNGHRYIGMIGGSQQDRIAGQPRIDGYKDALKLHGIEPKEEFIITGRSFRFQDGFDCFKVLYDKAPELTAIFAASDEMAMGIISAAYQKGIKVPEDLSIIGYDDLPLAEMAIPPLTTIAQPFEEMGKVAAEMVFNMIETGLTVESRIMPHRVIERKSVINNF